MTPEEKVAEAEALRPARERADRLDREGPARLASFYEARPWLQKVLEEEAIFFVGSEPEEQDLN